MTAAHPERRRAPRHVVRMLCEAVRERDFSLLGQVVLDLSPDGMLLRTRARALTGEPVIVSFFEPRSTRWYDVEATVARVVHARRAGDAERCVALEFDSLDREARAHLRAALRGVRRAPAAAGRDRRAAPRA